MKKVNLMMVAIAMLVATMFMSGCATQIGALSVVSAKTTSIQIGQKGGTVIGKGATIDDAIKDALIKAGGDYNALIDTKVEVVQHYIVIWSWETYKVTGTPVKV